MHARRLPAILASLVLIASVIAIVPHAGAQNTPRCNGLAATIVGTNGDDTLRGTSGRDVIVGLAGDDVIFGLGGRDVLCGGPGRDRVEGGPGRDLILGAGGGDRLFGGPGDDDVRGERGTDRVFGGRGDDSVDGGIGFDRLYGDPDDDFCITDALDIFIRNCEDGNYRQFTGNGDRSFRPRLDAATFPVAEHCFEFTRVCDQFYAARIRLDGSTDFDALAVEALDRSGNTIANYGVAGDQYRGVFLFHERPARLNVDSGGGSWEIIFLQESGLRGGTANTSGTGNQVYIVKRPVRGSDIDATAEWNGFGHFAVVAISPSEGRDLVVNEVRFSGDDTPPFSATTAASSGVTLVQVLSDAGSWSVTFAK